MKSEKGVTLTALVVYIVVFIIILTMMTTISNRFYQNIGQIKDSPKYISEFNKFSMFFVTDVKRNSEIASINADGSVLEFSDGTTYTYKNEAIYRNDTEIAKYVKSFSFTQSENTVNKFTKKIVNINAILGNNKEEIKRNIDFVLKYW